MQTREVYRLKHFVLLTILVLLFAVSTSWADIDAPHNATITISCSSCHDPDKVDSPLYSDSDINNFCLANCHFEPSAPYTSTSAPKVLTHSSDSTSTDHGTWSRDCTDCHDPHIQAQKSWKNANAATYFLVRGQLTGYTYNSGPDTTTITYSGASWKAGWDTSTITDKTTSQRRPILMPNIGKTGWTFVITAMDATTMTVKGDLTPVYQYVNLPTTFAVILGQYIRQYIDADNNGSLETGMKYFDHSGSFSFANDESATGTDPTPNGICQVCHTQTGHWRNNGTLADHYSGLLTCTTCHRHVDGFDHPEHGGVDCQNCHGHDAGYGGAVGGKGTYEIHSRHTENDGDDAKGPNLACTDCHAAGLYPFFKTGIDSNGDGAYDLSETDVCDACHVFTPPWPGSACTSCHATTQNGRAAVASQFSANSHHVQGVDADGEHCYQCHWEADSSGRITEYHRDANGYVDLVIYGAGTAETGDRPVTYAGNVLQYTADGSRGQITGLNTHCLSCHDENTKGVDVFGDDKSPDIYAWDDNSIAARYSQAEADDKTPWGKYSGANIPPKDQLNKAFSAHGNPGANHGGWNDAGGWPDKRGGAVTVACFDCHNSHGSTAGSGVEPTTSYAAGTGTSTGGILKDTTGGGSGYTVLYKPLAGGDEDSKNIRYPGASLCFDCHLTKDADDNPDTKPWSYDTTFGASQAILGYFDSQFFTPGGPGVSGSQQRFTYKGYNVNNSIGGHFGASIELASSPMHDINGLCTPCHDPHGVSPTHVGTCSNPAYVTKLDCETALGEGNWTPQQEFGVPMLKGTWITSPYMEDAAPTTNNLSAGLDAYQTVTSTPGYHIDQNTFPASWNYTYGSGPGEGITQEVNVFAGLCLQCHTNDGSDADIDPDGGIQNNQWGTMDRVHETVKGWGAGNKHKFSCSKCHTPHNGSVLPRLMVTNCLDFQHRGRVTDSGAPNRTSHSGSTGAGGGGFPSGGAGGGGYNGLNMSFGPVSYNYGFGSNFAYGGVACHDNIGSGVWPDKQLWNQVTPWTAPPVITSGPAAIDTGLKVLLHMDEAAWTGTANELQDSSAYNRNHGRAYAGANTAAGGICGRAGSFDGTAKYVQFSYAAGLPANNFTMSVWIKPTTTHQIDTQSTTSTAGTAGQRYVFYPDNRGSVAGAGISAGTDGISVYEQGTSYMPPLAVYSGAISSTEWTHVAVVYSNKQPSIYVNGVLKKTGLTSIKATVYAPTIIGGGAYGYFPGGIDEAAVYSRAFTADEVLSLYQYQQTCPTIPVSTTIQWSTAANGTSCVDYGDSDSYGTTKCDASSVKTHSVTLFGLDNNSLYYYQARSSNAGGEETSGGSTFNTAVPPTVPVQTAENDIVSAVPVTVDLVWGAATDPDGDPVEYYVELDDDAGFGSSSNSGWITAISWTTPALPTSTRYYWRVKARNQTVPANVTGWSAVDDFMIATAVPPAAPVPVAEPDVDSGFPQDITLEWGAVTAPDTDAVQYYVEVDDNSDFSSQYKLSGWIGGTSYVFTNNIAPEMTFYWRVKARDAVHTDAVSAWSTTDVFDTKDSCPFVFVWNGCEYEYITDIQGPVIGLPPVTPAARSVGLFRPSSIVLNNLVPDNGRYRIKLRETLKEITYLDEVKLLVVDYPAGYELVSSTAENTYSYGYVNPETIYTIRDSRPPVSAFATNGDNILASVAAVDNVYAPLDYDVPEYITLDFGTIDNPANAKLVIDGWTIYNAGLRISDPVQPHVEVLDADGNWITVLSFGEPAGDLKRMVVPLAGVFRNADQRLRLHLGRKSGGRWRLDRVMLDESTPVPVVVHEVAAEYGDLHHAGMVPHNPSSLNTRIFAEDGSWPDLTTAYGYGRFTRYGDVMPLLASTDDKFVIMRHGDAVALEFPEIDVPAPEMTRGYLLKVDLYYKSFRVENNVEPLPFHGMSIYPPAAGENYPGDPEHLEYLETYNTREYIKGQ